MKIENKIYKTISPEKHLLDVNLKEVFDYRYLLYLFIRRDFVSTFKQTILGPIWFFIQPIFTTIIFTFVFSNIASIPTDGIPPILFYMCGITFWNYFSECLTKTSTIFINNASIFGKVYFPRLILPISIVCSNLLKFTIQFALFFIFLIYFSSNGHEIQLNTCIFLLPLLILIMAGLGLGMGIIISSLTTKYRDFQVLVSFGVQLLMYATPIAYPLSLAKEKLGSYYWVSVGNPMTAVIETVKFAFFSEGEFNLAYLLYSFSFMIVTLTLCIIIFNKVEQTFMDTV